MRGRAMNRDGEHGATGGTGGTANTGAHDADWAPRVIEMVAREAIAERRRARRWRIFFRFAFLLVLGIAVLIATGVLGGGANKGGRHTAQIDVRGVIAADAETSAATLTRSLRAAFGDAGTAGVVLRVNSPGGSPVQAGIVFDEIRRLRKKHPDIPIHAVIEEVGASGAYYIAAASDRIYVDKASLVGSIGVLMDGFGFVEAMRKFGVERRLFTAGTNKVFLDPFSPVDERQQAHARTMLAEIHQQFIGSVRAGRGDRLKESPEIYSGLIWTGGRSLDLGLADAFGTVDSVARDVIGAPNVVDFSTRENVVERVARRVGAQLGAGFAAALSGADLGARLR